MNQLINNPVKLAYTMKAGRKNLHLTQEEAAGKSGLLPKTVSLLENHPEKCSVETLLKHLSALELELYLIDRDVEPEYQQEKW
jgi:HTH-type transcriptional regulator / antitoxin HipB